MGFWTLWWLLGCGEDFHLIVSDWCCVSHFPVAGHSTWQKCLKEDALWFPISEALVHHDGECMGESSVLGGRDMAEFTAPGRGEDRSQGQDIALKGPSPRE